MHKTNSFFVNTDLNINDESEENEEMDHLVGNKCDFNFSIDRDQLKRYSKGIIRPENQFKALWDTFLTVLVIE